MDYENKVFYLDKVFGNYYTEDSDSRLEKPNGYNYYVHNARFQEIKVFIAGEKLLNASRKTTQAVMFQDLDIEPYAYNNEMRAKGTATDVLIVCDDVDALVLSNVKAEKAYNLKVKASK